MSGPEEYGEMSTEDLEKLIPELSGGALIDVLMQLAHRAAHEDDHFRAASLYERICALFLEGDNFDDALRASARALDAWSSAFEWEHVDEVVAKVAEFDERVFDSSAWIDYCSSLASVEAGLGNLEKAIEQYDRAIMFADEQGSTFGRAMNLWQKGKILLLQNHSRVALDTLQRAVDDARESENLALATDILADISMAESRLMMPRDALAHAREARLLLEDAYPIPGMGQRVKYAEALAEIASANFGAATQLLRELVDESFGYMKAKILIKLSETDHANSASWEARAYSIAKNLKATDLIDHLEINRAMAQPPMLAIPVLDTIVGAVTDLVDEDIINRAKLALARKHLDDDNPAKALEALSNLTADHFGDDMGMVLTFEVLSADAMIANGQFSKAQAIAASLSRLDPTVELVSAVAEGYWQRARIELETRGPTREWERLAHASIAYSVRAHDFDLVVDRSQVLAGVSPSESASYREPITTVEALLEDIQNENDLLDGPIDD